MIRAALLLVLSVPALGDQAQCALDGAGASGDAITAAVRMWAATERCTETSVNYDKVQCGWDIVTVISSMSAVATTIAHAVDSCATLKTDACGLAAADFVSASTSLSSNAYAAAQDCTGGGTDNLQHSSMGNCVGDLTGTVQGLFGTASALNSIKKQCDDGDSCAQNSLAVLGTVSAFGGGIAGSYNDCDAAAHAGFDAFNQNAGGGSGKAACAGDVLSSLSDFTNLANAAIDMSKKCAPVTKRLFEQSKVDVASRSQSSAMWMAMLPVSAFVSLAVGFFGGMRLKKGAAKTNFVNVDEERALAESF